VGSQFLLSDFDERKNFNELQCFTGNVNFAPVWGYSTYIDFKYSRSATKNAFKPTHRNQPVQMVGEPQQKKSGYDQKCCPI